MNGYDSWNAREHITHQDQVLDAIKDYHHFAPAMLALRATQVQRRAETSLGRWEEPIELTNRASLPVQAAWARRGAFLIRRGIQLRDGLAAELDSSRAIVAAASHTGG